MQKGKFIIELIITTIVAFVSAYFIMPLINKINFGLDLQGGFEVLYEVAPLNKDDELTEDMLYSTYKAISKRVDILGVSEPEISIEGDNHIRVKLAGITNVDDARNTIASTAVLSFRDASDNLLMTSDILGGEAKATTDQFGRPAISLKIKDVDTFYNVTKKVKNMTNNIMVIWLDYQEDNDSYHQEQTKAELGTGGCGTEKSHCLSAARVEEAFASDVIIQGNFTKKEVSTLVELINSGALPTNLNEISSRTVEASFGMNALNKTLIASLIGLGIVMIIMIIMYHFSGFIASLGLIIYTFASFLIFYLIEGVLTLPGIAAMLLGIGMAVDANIINFEKIREYLRIGTPLKEANEKGNKSSFTSIIDANITTIIAAIIMFIFGESSVKGFATMLIINVIVTIIVMVYLVKLILKLFIKTNIFDKHPNLFIGVSKKKIIKSKEIITPFAKLNINKHFPRAIIISLVLIISGVVTFLVSGANYGVDFTGGTNLTISNGDNTEEVLNYLSQKYTISNKNKNDNYYSIVLSETLSKEELTEVKNTLLESYDTTGDIYVVSGTVKKELVKNAIKSLIYASIGIIIYIAIRFRFNYAISAIIALIHDIAITFLFFAVTKLEINSIFIASILTIIGYSINDTIVTFDNIRDIYKNKYKNNITNPEDLKELVNISIKRTLKRTILTTITTIVPVITLIIFGSKEILNFNIALLVGFIAGTYSSILISNAIWLFLEIKRIKRPKKEHHDELEELEVKGINC